MSNSVKKMKTPLLLGTLSFTQVSRTYDHQPLRSNKNVTNINTITSKYNTMTSNGWSDVKL